MIRPSITEPVSRSIVVRDVARSAAFYREVIGFETPSANEVVCGPARIEMEAGEGSPSLLFFGVDNVRALHEAIHERGGHVSQLEKANFIKMRVFEVRDPDGHVLWFGESFDNPVPAQPPPLFEKALPQLPFNDVPAAVAYYRDVLGFKINYAQDDLGVMDRDRVTMLLIPRTDQSVGSAYMYVRDADALYAELKASGAKIGAEPVSHPWGLRDFEVLDCEGNRLTFGQTFE